MIEEDPRPLRQLATGSPRPGNDLPEGDGPRAVRRYRTAVELADDLRRWLGRTDPRPAVGPVERTYRWAHRNPRVAGLAAALVLAFTAGFLAVLWQWRLCAELNLKESQASFMRCAALLINSTRVSTRKAFSLCPDSRRSAAT